jgi:hypothetical protein
MDTTALAERLDRSAGELRGDNARELIDLLREAATRLRAVAGEPASDVKWIRLRGSQGEPAGRMIVTAEMEDGREIELIRDSHNEIDHSVRLTSVIATPNPEQPARAKGESHE